MGPLSPDETTPLNFYWRHSTPREDLDMTPTRSLDRHQFESGTEPISSSPGSCGTKRRRKSRKKMFQDCESHKKGNNSFSGLNEKMESLQNFNSCDRDQNKVVSNYWRRILEFPSPIWIQLWILLVLLPSPGKTILPKFRLWSRICLVFSQKCHIPSIYGYFKYNLVYHSILNFANFYA